MSGRRRRRTQTFVDQIVQFQKRLQLSLQSPMKTLKGVPSAKEAVAALAEFVGGLPVLAPNTSAIRLLNGCQRALSQYLD